MSTNPHISPKNRVQTSLSNGRIFIFISSDVNRIPSSSKTTHETCTIIISQNNFKLQQIEKKENESYHRVMLCPRHQRLVQISYTEAQG